MLFGFSGSDNNVIIRTFRMYFFFYLEITFLMFQIMREVAIFE